MPTPGTAMVIDVSGDTDVSVANLGPAPVHAVQQTANQILVVNQAVNGLNVPTTSCLVAVPPTPPNQTFNVCSSITKLSFSGTAIVTTPPPTTITLPPYSGANFVAVAPTDTLAYVTLPTYPPDPTRPLTIVPSVGVVSTQSNNVVATIPLSNNPAANPVALAVTPDKSKLYVANQGLNSISGFNTVDRSSRQGSPTSTTSPPIWLVARTDNQRVYALEADGGLAELDTTSTAGPDSLTEYPSTYSVPGATTMTYDSNLNRLYIPGGQVMKIIDISQTPAQVVTTISIPSVPGVPAVPANAVAVAALPDGSRAYVASVPSTAQPSQVNISAVQGDGITATYTYTLTGGHDLTPGITVAVSGLASAYDAFNGTYVVGSVSPLQAQPVIRLRRSAHSRPRIRLF